MVTGLLARFAPSLLPGMGALLNPWVIGGVLVALAGVWFHGYTKGRDKLDDYITAQAVAATRIITRQGAITERIVVKYVEREGKTRVVTETIEREVSKYVEKNPDGVCLDAGWRVLHDAAATGAVPAPSRDAADRLRTTVRPPGGLGLALSGTGAADGHGQLRTSPPLRGSR